MGTRRVSTLRCGVAMTDANELMLTPPPSGVLRSDAVFSADGMYRYVLTRAWNDSSPTALFMLLNPSTADERANDPTVRRLMDFARRWGAGGITLLNLFGLRSTYPDALKYARDPVGPEWDCRVREVIEQEIHNQRPEPATIICGWGTNGNLFSRSEEVAQFLRWYVDHDDLQVTCLDHNSNLEPKHPLYVRKTVVPEPWLGMQQDEGREI